MRAIGLFSCVGVVVVFGIVGIVAVAGGGGGDGGGSGLGSGLSLGKLVGKTSNFVEALGVDVNMEMTFVEGGQFTMGCTPEQGDECDDDEKPAHLVTVGDFYIGKHEVTQRQWKVVMGEGNNPSHFKGDDLPVENVSWNDIQEFIRKLNSALDKNYRLPTEAEWEYAARGGSKSRGFKYSGGNDIGDVAWYYENSGDGRLNDSDWRGNNLDIDRIRNRVMENNNRTRPVGTKRGNELGIHDMSGNVWEWVNDLYGDYTALSKTNPTGAERGSLRVIRGGSWYRDARDCRVSIRFDFTPDFRIADLGFRLAVSP